MHKNYPSHVSKEQFEKIRSILENRKKKTKPRNLDLYELFCAVLYVLKSGCQWRMLPKNFPKWQTVYYYFQIWSKNSDKEPSVLQLGLLSLYVLFKFYHINKDKSLSRKLSPLYLNQTHHHCFKSWKIIKLICWFFGI